MSSTTLDLAKMFKAASKSLAENQTALNQADEYNHNHGDNMVEIFGLITRAMTAKKTAAPAEQLEYASQLVAKKGTSGSATAYAEGLSRAASQFNGRQVTAENAVELISALMGSGASQQQSGGSAMDLMGSLLGGSGQTQESSPMGGLLESLLGGGAAPQSTSGGSGDMLGSLIGGLMGSDTSQKQSGSGGIDTGDLLNIGMQLFQAYQSGSGKSSGQGSGLAGSLLDMLLSGSAMGSSSHRTQSGKLVADALLTAAGKYLSSRTRKR